MILQQEAAIPQIEEVRDDYVRVTVEPLARGFAHTLGNGMRRVLLNSIRGAAITSVRIEDVLHEFSTIPNMKEDTTEFLLNLRGIRLRANVDRVVELLLDVEGARTVTADDVQVPGEYEIVNPDLYLATLDSADAKLRVTMKAQTGYGFQPSEVSANGEHVIGVIPVDAVFTPIRKVSYEVQPAKTAVGAEGAEQLLLEVWTDASIDATDAIRSAARQLQEELSRFTTLGAPEAPQAAPAHELVGLSAEQYNTPIDVLQLSVRAHNCLKRSGLMSIGNLLEMSEEELLTLKNFGEKSYVELIERLAEMSYLRNDDIRLQRVRSGAIGGDDQPLDTLPPAPPPGSEPEIAPLRPSDGETDPEEERSALGAALLSALREAGSDGDAEELDT